MEQQTGFPAGAIFQQSGLPAIRLPDAVAGRDYGAGLFVTVGGGPHDNLPLTWTADSLPQLPPGLTIDMSRGVVRGSVPSSAIGQDFGFTIDVRDSTGALAIGNPVYRIRVVAP